MRDADRWAGRRAGPDPACAIFDQHAAGSFAPKPAHALDQRVRALGRLETEHDPLLHHHGLPDIDGAERARDLEAALDIGARLRVGRDRAQHARRRAAALRMLCDADDPEPPSSSNSP